MKGIRPAALLALLALLPGCVSLGGLGRGVQPPTVEAAAGRPSELRYLAPSLANPVGGVSVRLWTRLGNPNPIGLVLSTLHGTLALEGVRAADVSFPLGLPLPAAGDTVIPLDVDISFTNLPRLAEVVSAGIGRGSVAYQLNGTAAVDAGLLGQPSFGPMTLLRGDLQTR